MPKRNLPYRKSIRLEGWNYQNQGLYFVTICTKSWQHYFGEIKNGIMGLSMPGCLASYYWRQIPEHQAHVDLDEFIIMPNHVHGIIRITSHVKVGSPIYRDPTKAKSADESPIHRDPIKAKPADEPPIHRDPTKAKPADESPIHRDPTKAKLADEPPIHRDPTKAEPTEKPANRKRGGITGEHNPMLYKTHLGKIIRWYKGRCTYEIRKRNYPDFAWHGRFYDHIIRNENDLNRIRKYIQDNPLRWQIDKEDIDGNKIHEQAMKYLAGKD